MGGAGVRKIPQWVGAKADNFIQALFPSLSTIMSSKIFMLLRTTDLAANSKHNHLKG
jgi:hypothetical protein